MEKKTQSNQVQNLLDKVSPEDLEKIQQYTNGGDTSVDEEWLLLAEWLKFAGYQAYLDARDDRIDENGNLIITLEEISILLEANRKLEALQQYKHAHGSFVGSVSANAKKPTSMFKSMTKNIINQTKVNNG